LDNISRFVPRGRAIGLEDPLGDLPVSCPIFNRIQDSEVPGPQVSPLHRLPNAEILVIGNYPVEESQLRFKSSIESQNEGYSVLGHQGDNVVIDMLCLAYGYRVKLLDEYLTLEIRHMKKEAIPGGANFESGLPGVKSVYYAEVLEEFISSRKCSKIQTSIERIAA
jgi:hypothetical protein